ncbi:MAG: hypothetical protein CMJ49_09140 [Planctomycetaceae bacterium]|nr:hypothetical protein [Planctomycetaceae bacterium]
MRTDIYYWKCDNPLPMSEKRVYNDKYGQADITETVGAIATTFLGEPPDAVRHTGSAGNHYAYLIDHAGMTYFFRSDDGKLDDDYMLAEQAAMELAREHGVPVPHLFACDATLGGHPVRYQIFECVDFPDLNKHDQAGELDREAIGRQVGAILARLHGIRLEGFGFINTQKLAASHTIEGLDGSNEAYFDKCLETHLAYLRDVEFLTGEEIREIEALFSRHAGLLGLSQGSLIHKDMAFWNLLGSPTEVAAVIDWDDVVSGDPVDDLSIVRCFYDDDVWRPLLESYQEVRRLPDDFEGRLGLYLTRNMLWKSMIRHYMGYFEITGDFFILNRETEDGLEAATRRRLAMGVAALRRF